jgi:hypothetical protein
MSSKSIRVGKTRVGVSRQKRADGRGSRTSVYTYKGTGSGPKKGKK